MKSRINDAYQAAAGKFWDKSCVSPNELRAARWYSLKLSEQCMILENRIEFVETELEHLRKSTRDKSYRNSKLEKLIDEAKQMVRLEKDRNQERKQVLSNPLGLLKCIWRILLDRSTPIRSGWVNSGT